MLDDQWMPLVGADRARIESLRGLAEGIAALTGKPVKLVRFTTRQEMPQVMSI